MTTRHLKEWQNLIAGMSVAISLVYAGTAALRLSYNAGQAIQQHEQILSSGHQSLERIEQLTKEIHQLAEQCK
jgi:hypothetical protein